MQTQNKALKALNDSLEILLNREEIGPISVQYGAFGEDGVTASTGTVLVEATNDGADWYPVKIQPADDSAAVANLAAKGLGYVSDRSYDRMRVRMSVIGGAQGVRVYVSQKTQ